MKSNTELDLAWNFVENTNRHVFLTGKAGTGKTTFLHRIREESLKRIVVVAPTGVAAINAKGVTIHSFFQMPFGPILPENDYSDSFKPNISGQNKKGRFQKKFNRKKIDLIRSLDLLVIDEISMVRADLLDGIDYVLRQYKDKNKVFGGVQVLMIGDLQQLAPVVKPDEWALLRPYYKTPFFFSSKVFRSSNPVNIELKTIFRQKDETFIKILNEIRNNKVTDETFDLLNSRYIPDFTHKNNAGYITLTTHNNRANKMNEDALSTIKEKSYYYEAMVDGIFPEYSFPTHERLELKRGAQVMFVKNDSSPDKRYFNGKIGEVISIDKEKVTVKCPDDDGNIVVTPEKWENIKYAVDEKKGEIVDNIIGSFTQLPLRLAWAITIHKSQGLTFEKAIIDTEASFAHGQTYVALSRCKTLEGMVLKSPVNTKAIIQNNDVLDFTRDIESHPPEVKQLILSRQKYQLDLMNELFDFVPLRIPVARCMKIYYHNKDTLQGNVLQPLLNIKEKGLEPLIKVGTGFSKELLRMTGDEVEPEKDRYILERIKKGTDYFLNQMSLFLEKPLPEINFITDNKAVKKDFSEQIKKIEDFLFMKKNCLEKIGKEGFSTSAYLDAKVKVLLNRKSGKPERKREREMVGKRPELFSALRELRSMLAEEEDVPHYHIFTQKSLMEICDVLPGNKAALKAINGMGKVRIKKYGSKILETINNYCLEKQIEPTFSDEKSISKVPKQDTKEISFKMFKDGNSIPEIALERDLQISTIKGHLATFVLKGKLKVEEIMDKEKVEKLRKLIKKENFDSLNELKSKLDDEFSYGELRLVLNDLAYKSKG